MVSGDGPALRIGAATAGDAAAVQRLLAETWHDTYDRLIGAERVAEVTARWHALPVLERQIADRDSAFLVARLDGVIVGHAFAGREGEDLDLRRLYVAPGSQRRGTGRALIEAVAARFPEAGRIVLAVARDNAPGVAFYERCGFVVVGSLVEDGIAHLRMARPAVRQP